MIFSNSYNELLQNLKDGKICIFETDTVTGIACTVFYDNHCNININKIFKIKNRTFDKKLPWLISSKKMLKEYIISIPNYIENEINEYWPGNATFVFNVNKKVPKFLCKENNNKNCIAFRIPNCDDLIKIIEEINCPLACTSANISGQQAYSNIAQVSNKVKLDVDFVYTKHLCKHITNKSSTIYDCTGITKKIIRG